MLSLILMRCLCLSAFVGVVGLLNTSIATAFESTDVDVETQGNHIESNLIADAENSSAIDWFTIDVDADIATLSATNRQDNLDHRNSDSPSVSQSITEPTPQNTKTDSSDSEQLSQVAPTGQFAENEEHPVEAQPTLSNQAIPDINEIDSTNSIDLLGLGALDQLPSVAQLSDVQPTDWAYQALQSLVERYGCIVGYPDETYKGQRALTRYEFAAGVNACLDRISELLAASTADAATKEDLAMLQRLQEEFAAELAHVGLRGAGGQRDRGCHLSNCVYR